MADKIWNSTSGDWNAASSWIGGVPGASDRALFDGRVQTPVNTAPSASVTEVWTTSAYKGRMWSQGSPGILNCRFIHQGSGPVYFAHDTGTTTVFVDSPNRINAFTWTTQQSGIGAGLANDPTAINLIVRMGKAIVTSAAWDVTTPANLGRIDLSPVYSDDSAIIDFGSDLYGGRITQNGGLFYKRAYIDDVPIYAGGGEFFSYNESYNYDFIVSGSYVHWLNNDGTNVLGNIYVQKGVFAYEGDIQAKSITRVVVYVGAEFRNNTKVTVTNLVNYNDPIPTMP